MCFTHHHWVTVGKMCLATVHEIKFGTLNILISVKA